MESILLYSRDSRKKKPSGFYLSYDFAQASPRFWGPRPWSAQQPSSLAASAAAFALGLWRSSRLQSAFLKPFWKRFFKIKAFFNGSSKMWTLQKKREKDQLNPVTRREPRLAPQGGHSQGRQNAQAQGPNHQPGLKGKRNQPPHPTDDRSRSWG